MGSRDYVVEQAAAREDRAQDALYAQGSWTVRRERELIEILETRPLLACVPGNYSTERNPPVGVELVAWVMSNCADPDRALAEAIYSPEARYRMHRAFAAQQAERECEALPESYWVD